MAEAQDIELAEGEPVSSKKKVVTKKRVLFGLLGLLGVLLLGGSIIGVLYLTGVLPSPPEQNEASPAEELKEAIYVALEPAFTVNFQGKGGARFLQLSVEVMTREPDVQDLLKKHMPMIRNDLVLLFSSKTSDELGTREGKEKLQKETLVGIQTVLEKEAGTKGVEAVYFTSFVMQ